jgi:predicted phage replisome organizer
VSDVKWIKIVTDIFDDEKIRFIETMPEGDTLALLWFRLLCLAGKSNSGGLLMMTDRIAYTEDMLASVFNRDVKIVRLALETFERLSMIEIVDNAVYITNWEKHQNTEGLDKIREQTRRRVASHREKKLLQELCNVTGNVTVTQGNGEVTQQNKNKKESSRRSSDFCGFLSDSDADELSGNAEQLNAVFDAAERAGFPHTQADLDRLNQIVADYHPEPVLNAINRAVDAGTTTRTWRYLLGILKSDPTGGAKPKEEAYTPKPHWEDES